MARTSLLIATQEERTLDTGVVTMRRLLQFVSTALILGAGFTAPTPPAQAASRPAQPLSWLSAWPMAGHDPQRTFRSAVAGPQHPRLLYKRKGVSVNLAGPDGSMYGSARRGRGSVAARFSASGRRELTYSHPTGFPFALLPGGDVALGGTDTGTLALYGPDGQALWRRTDVGLPKGSTPVVSAANLLYVPFLGHPDNNTSGLDVFRTSGERQRVEPGLPFSLWHLPRAAPSMRSPSILPPPRATSRPSTRVAG